MAAKEVPISQARRRCPLRGTITFPLHFGPTRIFFRSPLKSHRYSSAHVVVLLPPRRRRLPAPAPDGAVLAVLPVHAEGEDGRDEDGAPDRHQQHEEAGVGAAGAAVLGGRDAARRAAAAGLLRVAAGLQEVGGGRGGSGLAAALLPTVAGGLQGGALAAHRAGQIIPFLKTKQTLYVHYRLKFYFRMISFLKVFLSSFLHKQRLQFAGFRSLLSTQPKKVFLIGVVPSTSFCFLSLFLRSR